MRTYEILINEEAQELTNENRNVILAQTSDATPTGTPLSALRDYLSSEDTPAYLGKIPNEQPNCIGVYGLASFPMVEAIGKESSYDIAGFRILIHGNMNARATETLARTVYESLKYVDGVQMGDYFVQYIELDNSEPTFIGTDENNVYEFHVSGRIYYRR